MQSQRRQKQRGTASASEQDVPRSGEDGAPKNKLDKKARNRQKAAKKAEKEKQLEANLASVGVDPLTDPEGYAAWVKANANKEAASAPPRKVPSREDRQAGAVGSEDSSTELEEEGVWEPQLEFWELSGVQYLVDRISLDVFDEDGEVLHKWGEGPTAGAAIPAAPEDKTEEGEREGSGKEAAVAKARKGTSGTRLAGEDVGMRGKYEELGVDGYYEAHADAYSNPHLGQIAAVLQEAHEEGMLDFTRVMDLCCGNGEAAGVVRTIHPEAELIGVDPYTYQGFEQKIGAPCWRLSFDDIRRGQLLEQPGAEPKSFSCIISSFGLHLLDEKHTWAVVSQLVELTDTIVIITPHKRPELEGVCGLSKCGETSALTERGKAVRLKAYRISASLQ